MHANDRIARYVDAMSERCVAKIRSRVQLRASAKHNWSESRMVYRRSVYYYIIHTHHIRAAQPSPTSIYNLVP